MKQQTRWKTLLTIWLMLCVLLPTSSSALSTSGTDTETQNDPPPSATKFLKNSPEESGDVDPRTAFFLLKYDYDVLLARSAGKASLDSLRISELNVFWQDRLDQERKMTVKMFVVAGVSAVLAALLFYVGGGR